MGQDGDRKTEPVLRRIPGFLFHPARAFQDARDAPFHESLRYYAVLLGAAIMLMSAVAIIDALWMAQRYPAGYDALLLPIMAIGVITVISYGLVWFGIFALILHVFVWASGGRQGLVRTISVLLYAATPIHLFLWIPAALAIFSSPAGIAALIAAFAIPTLWAIVLGVVGLREFHELSTVRAVIPFLCTVPLILIIGLFAFAYAMGG